ncbi:glycerate kinase type-2 family protein [Haloarcula marina]|uniref:glycerate kinase type-2 family protein n=1 Tax=Haloarcula marina TaxID=2961574 RepID=UPI0020B782C5|nr:DUF4147 domain-containing protein [Halomicroarcula marina]
MIRNRDTLPATPSATLALDCLEAGIEAADPRRVVSERVSLSGDVLRVQDSAYDLSAFDRVLVLGGGNAAGYVAAALETVLGDRIDDGAVVTDNPVETDRVRVLDGDHPVPTASGVESTRQMLELAESAGPNDLVLAVVTGGGSALMAAPADPVELADLQAVTESLLGAGASIDEINAVRKHLSAIKGGRLAHRLGDARVAGLLFSDVIGDDLSVIASGPLVADDTTYEDALDVVETYDLDVPSAVRRRLTDGADGTYPETPKAGDPALDGVEIHVLANNDTALSAAAEVAEERGYTPLVLGSRVRGEAREAGKVVVGIAESAAAVGEPVDPPGVLLSGGETTVTIRGDGDGRGGPNQEFALSCAIERHGAVARGSADDVVVASADTDGIDGNSAYAGALVSGGTVDDRTAARRALAENDAEGYLDANDALVETGPTTTNVNDLRVVVVESPPPE